MPRHGRWNTPARTSSSRKASKPAAMCAASVRSTNWFRTSPSQTTLPVLAAGGLVDGADLVTVLALGAQGAVFGTALIATEESFAHEYHKQRLVEAANEDTVLTDAFHINWPHGANVRVLTNSVTRGERGDPFGKRRTVIGDDEGRPIYLFSTDSPLRSMTGDFEAMALYAGAGVGRISAVQPAADKIHAIATQAASLCASGAAQSSRTARVRLAGVLSARDGRWLHGICDARRTSVGAQRAAGS